MKPEKQITLMLNRIRKSRDFRGPLMFKATFYLAVILVIGLLIQACGGGGATTRPVE